MSFRDFGTKSNCRKAILYYFLRKSENCKQFSVERHAGRSLRTHLFKFQFVFLSWQWSRGRENRKKPKRTERNRKEPNGNRNEAKRSEMNRKGTEKNRKKQITITESITRSVSITRTESRQKQIQNQKNTRPPFAACPGGIYFLSYLKKG